MGENSRRKKDKIGFIPRRIEMVRVVRACRGFFSKISARDRKFFIRRPTRLIRRIRTRRGRILAEDLGGSFLVVEKARNDDYAAKVRKSGRSP